jgi:vacuolar-type H+-ATPase subunit D/Vma8
LAASPAIRLEARVGPAPENVLIPEAESVIKFGDDQLETAERENAGRERWRKTELNY